MTTSSNTTSYIPTKTNNAQKPKKTARFWIKEIEAGEAEAKRFRDQAREAIEEFEFAKSQGQSKGFWSRALNQHFAVFWSTLQTLLPATYSQTPTPVAKRRFDDDDDIGRVAGLILERYARAMLDETPFDEVMERLTQDFMITGFGCPRVRVVPKPERATRIYLNEGEPLPPDTKVYQDETGFYVKQVIFPKSDAIEPEWVSWDTYVHTPGARTEQQVWWRGFIDYFDKEQFKARFGDKYINKINFKYTSQQDDDEKQDELKRELDEQRDGFAKVVEVWDYRENKIFWVSPDCKEHILDEKEDIYELKNFFPAPMPILSSVPDGSLYPIPDYVQVRHCIEQMDFLANRIRRLTKALRAEGVYDKDIKAIQRLAREGTEADLVPVENYMDLAGKGGINSVVQWLDKSPIASALLQAYQAFDRQKELYYEISGHADILRGVGRASESATMTAVKDRHVSVRQSQRVRKIERVARDLIELMLDLGLAKHDDSTIIQMSQAEFLAEGDRQYIIPAIQLLRNDKFRTFRIDIETDSTVAVSSEQEKAARLELFELIQTLAQNVVQVKDTAPEMLPAMREAALYTVRGLKQSAALESSIEDAFASVEEALQAELESADETPDPEMEKVAIEREKLALQREKEMRELDVRELEAQRDIIKEQNKTQELHIKEEKLNLEAEGKLLEADLKRENMDKEERIKAAELAAKHAGDQVEVLEKLVRMKNEKEDRERPLVLSQPKKKFTLPSGETIVSEPIE